MNQNATLKNTLADLVKLQTDLEKKGTVRRRTMFEQIIAAHAEILKSFGLPKEEDWKYSSAADFYGSKGLVELNYS